MIYSLRLRTTGDYNDEFFLVSSTPDNSRSCTYIYVICDLVCLVYKLGKSAVYSVNKWEFFWPTFSLSLLSLLLFSVLTIFLA